MSTQPATLAPHVDPRWRDAFVMELRLRDVPGRLIGDALAEVDAHCLDADEDATTAFGDPVAYAQGLAEHLPTRTRLPLRDGAAVVVETAGVLGVVWALPPWLNGDPLVTSRGMAATVVVSLLAAVALCLAPAPTLRWLTRARWWQAALAGSGVAVALAALTMLAPDGRLEAPAAPLALVSLVLLAVGAVALHAGGATADVVSAPGADDARSVRRARTASVLVSAALPVVALLVAGGLALLAR